MPPVNFQGLCVMSLESRRAQEMAKLIANFGGAPLVVPSVQEVPLESNRQALGLVQKLSENLVNMAIFMTGAGVRILTKTVEGVCSREQLTALLSRVQIVARGPKPVAALRELGIQVDLAVPEPNTWRDLLSVLDGRRDAFPLTGRRVALQEYGVPNPELSAALEQRGATVLPVCLYEWALPSDTSQLEGAVHTIVADRVHILLVASSIQIRHLFQVAQAMGQQEALGDALSRAVIASIGPLTSEELRSRGLSVDIECSHPKMGFLVKEAAEKGPTLLALKR